MEDNKAIIDYLIESGIEQGEANNILDYLIWRELDKIQHRYNYEKK